ncbi:MAG: Nif11-like leader peptide family natural product precursor [Deltaproteobacteria bacterium]|jgi:predicted ribosomally synthesized peptide with nif11-like leader|nr:Nif11-like leader peptide family natural product precursor [Deltaproteobacteria bacterium]
MSIESAKAFLERMRNDEDFRNSVVEIATSEERMEYVKGAGFDFTKDEIANLKGELSDDDLDNVAGGGWCIDIEVDSCSLCALNDAV